MQATAITTPDRPKRPFELAPARRPRPRGALEVGTRLDGGRYELLSLLDAGSTCAIYCARQVRLERTVAIKVFTDEFAQSPVCRDWIHSEAVTGAALRHPNLIQVLDRGEHEGRPYLVMQLGDGESLSHHLTRFGRVRRSAILSIAQDVLAALMHMHERGFVHRDVKPQNILISHPNAGDGRPRAQLCDFGIATPVGDGGVATAGVCGTPEYIAPEQARGEAVDCRADLYSLGITMFHMATGELPFAELDTTALLRLHAQSHVPMPSAFNPEVDPFLEEIILRATSLDRQDRYQSAAEMKEAVDAMAHGKRDEPSVIVDDGPARGDTTTSCKARPVPASATWDGSAETLALRSSDERPMLFQEGAQARPTRLRPWLAVALLLLTLGAAQFPSLTSALTGAAPDARDLPGMLRGLVEASLR